MIGVQPARVLVYDGPVLVSLRVHGVHHLGLELPHRGGHLVPPDPGPALPAHPLLAPQARVLG